jgi:hypothetical protein
VLSRQGGNPNIVGGQQGASSLQLLPKWLTTMENLLPLVVFVSFRFCRPLLSVKSA